MRICFVLSQSLESPSGVGRFGPLARELANLGHGVEVVALHHDWRATTERSFETRGVRITYVGQMHVRKAGSRKTYFSPPRLLQVAAASTLALARYIRASRADVIQVCKPQPINALAARLAARGRPMFCDCDDYEAESNRFGGKWQRRVMRAFEDGIVGYAAGLTVNTRYMYDYYRHLGYPASHLVYVPNGVERERFGLNADPSAIRRELGLHAGCPMVGYVGTMSIHTHAVDLLLDAFARLAERLPDAQLLLVGGGEDYDELVGKAYALGIAGRTTFAGRVAPEDVPKYYAACNVTVEPVRDDLIARTRCPLKIVESLAVGVPVVTGNVGDRAEMLEGGNLGLLVPPGDARAIAEALWQILSTPAIREVMAARALASRERWYWEHLARDFAKVYAAGIEGS